MRPPRSFFLCRKWARKTRERLSVSVERGEGPEGGLTWNSVLVGLFGLFRDTAGEGEDD